jgi:hypothetical protein
MYDAANRANGTGIKPGLVLLDPVPYSRRQSYQLSPATPLIPPQSLLCRPIDLELPHSAAKCKHYHILDSHIPFVPQLPLFHLEHHHPHHVTCYNSIIRPRPRLACQLPCGLILACVGRDAVLCATAELHGLGGGSGSDRCTGECDE